MELTEDRKDLRIRIPIEDFNLSDTLDCGQCFRFQKTAEGRIRGIAHGRILEMTQSKEEILIKNMTKTEFDLLFFEYFDFNRDYQKIKEILCTDPVLKQAISYAGGIHVLNQDSFEVLISFLISQNNNIPRIKKSIQKLCEAFGEEIADSDFAFPTAQTLAGLSLSDLAGIGLGYRDAYLLDCAQRISDGRLDLQEIIRAELPKARELLRTVKGIGPKVAECALLFGFRRAEAFPVDTWMKKVLKTHYPDGFPTKFATHAGIAQQYLFHYIRTGS